ncbi:uncharacterized protein LOC106638162 [Copidosoma floridanum]|uniref:uncharacterized protein LOC106638162 n=1 Tax=Copidosoma floridanum TaxID=29053 RepID=UPI0006C95B3F|nr:uncharacterized protein LOC106638162 [Copidosoma floridanum]
MACQPRRNKSAPVLPTLVVVVAVVVSRAIGAPSSTKKPVELKPPKSVVPYWHMPCGASNEVAEPVDPRNPEEEISESLRSLRIQHELMMTDYLSRDYEFLYERVRIGVHEHQYIPNWLPGKKDVHLVKRLRHGKPQLIASHLPKLHSDLQKFAVALEEMVEDETYTERIQNALYTTQSYLKMMICEVESSIYSLPALSVPSRIDRGIMSEAERDPVDDTRRLIRDWGVLLKYKDYLHAWRHVFDY